MTVEEVSGEDVDDVDDDGVTPSAPEEEAFVGDDNDEPGILVAINSNPCGLAASFSKPTYIHIHTEGKY